MATSKVEICGVDTATLPVLTNDRMRELFPLVHSGDRAAREEFIRGNLRLVLSVVQRFNNRGESADDLFQVGCIGLIKALDHFDVSQNVRFSTYAVPMIIGEIRRYLRDNNPIRVSRSMRDTAYKALQARDRLVISLHREPTVEEMAAELGIRVQDPGLEAGIVAFVVLGELQIFLPVFFLIYGKLCHEPYFSFVKHMVPPYAISQITSIAQVGWKWKCFLRNKKP